MSRLFYQSFVLLLLFSFTMAEQSDAQTRRRRSRQSPVINQQQGTADERAELDDKCSTPGRPKPEVEFGLNGSPVLCGRAISFAEAVLSTRSKAQKVSGVVRVNIVIDETGKVVWAEAVEGHPLLRSASVRAACLSRHSPIKISGRPVKAASVITYNFVSQ